MRVAAAAIALSVAFTGCSFDPPAMPCALTSVTDSAPVLTSSGVQNEKSSSVSKAQIVSNYGTLALSFEANEGQTDKSVKFMSRGKGYGLFLTGREAVPKTEAYLVSVLN